MKNSRRYNAGSTLKPEGYPEDPSRCVVETYTPLAGGTSMIEQCRRYRGFGPDQGYGIPGLYCKQHGKIVEAGRRLRVPQEV